MSSIVFVLLFLLNLTSANNLIQDEFSFNGYLNLEGGAQLESDGLFRLTNTSNFQTGHAFYNMPLQFKNTTNGSVFSFSTTFVFAIVPEFSGHGLAFVISPTKGIPGGASAQYLGLFNLTNNGDISNHIVAVEFDTFQNEEFDDINDNHVGIDINGLNSIKSAPAGYYTDANGSFHNLSLISGEPMQVWIEYDGLEKKLNVTLYTIDILKPKSPLLSLTRDLAPYIYESMYVGFSSSTGKLVASNYILGWSFKMNGQAQEIDVSHLPELPNSNGQREDPSLQKVLAIVLSLLGAMFVLAFIIGVFLIMKKKKFMEVLEDWEIQYGPHRFTYKDLYFATKGFKDDQLLGRGGFGRVYKGTLPMSNVQIAVKRISHDSKQGMREFVAEIATIGRLRHQNLVRLLGYCRRKNELLLVYDYIPNGSLDKFLYGQTNCTLNWAQRFKIIKDVASALLYLHQQWVQVVIHRDIKSANVLIDKEMKAKLGDFGLAKLCEHGNDPQTSHIAGTLGYIAPELARTGKASTSTDLYAFGTFMLEVACGTRPIEPRASPERMILSDWVIDCWDKGDILETVDQKLGTKYVAEEAELVLKLGLLCCHPVAQARPNMSTVVQILNGDDHLPDDLSDIIKACDFNEASSRSYAPADEKFSVHSLTFTEPFVSKGR